MEGRAAGYAAHGLVMVRRAGQSGERLDHPAAGPREAIAADASESRELQGCGVSVPVDAASDTHDDESHFRDLNPGPMLYESIALPLS